MTKKLTTGLAVTAVSLLSAFTLFACADKSSGNDQKITAAVDITVDYSAVADYIGSSGVRYNIGNNSGGGNGYADDIANIEFSASVVKGKNSTIEISFIQGIDPSSLTVTESGGKSFTKTTDDDTLVITIANAAQMEYAFVVSGEPAHIYENIDIAVPDDSALESSNPAYLDMLKNAKIYAYDKSTNTAEFVNLTKLDGSDRVFNIQNKYIKADTSKNKFDVYMQFDADPKRVPYDDYSGLLLLEGDGGSYSDTASSVEYAKIPDTNLYGQKFTFSYSPDPDGYTLKFDASNAKNDVKFFEGQMDSLFYLTTYLDYSASMALKFDLRSVKKGDGNFTEIAGNNDPLLKKEYGVPYEYVFEFDSIESTLSTPTAEQIEQALEYSALKPTIDGKQLPADKYSYSFEADKHCYTVKIGATEMPYDFSGVDHVYYKPNFAPESVALNADTAYAKFTLSDDFDTSLNYYTNPFVKATKDGKTTVMEYIDPSDDTYEKQLLVNIDKYESFKIEGKFNGEAFSKTFVKGVDFKKVIDGSGAFAGYKVIDASDVSSSGFNWSHILGDGTGDYVDYVFGADRLNVKFVQSTPLANHKHPEIELYITDAEYAPIDLTVTGDLLNDDVTYYKDNEEISADEVLADGKEYVVSFNTAKDYGIMDETNYDVKLKLYSGDTLIFEWGVNENGTTPESPIAGYEFAADNPTTFVFSPVSGGGIEGVGYNVDFRVSPLNVIAMQTTGGDPTYDYVFVSIDRMVIEVTEK